MENGIRGTLTLIGFIFISLVTEFEYYVTSLKSI